MKSFSGGQAVWKSMVGGIAAMLVSSACLAADLTPTERQWLKGAVPVVAFARESGLPMDIVVQPQSTHGASPLALAYVDGRCKLVFSMRGNPEAQRTLERIEPALMDAALQLMAAHEMGHCRRYMDGSWFGVPAGFTATVPDTPSPDVRDAYLNMQAVRREEAYGDLVGLAWTQQRHPQLYERVHAWLLTERSRDLLPGSHHDTLTWVRLAPRGVALAGAPIFTRAFTLWSMGLEMEH